MKESAEFLLMFSHVPVIVVDGLLRSFVLELEQRTNLRSHNERSYLQNPSKDLTSDYLVLLLHFGGQAKDGID